MLSIIKEIGVSREQLKQFRKNKFSILEICEGTTFQKKVWNEILKIEKGKTKTYKEIALAINKPNACRAVASACGKNKFPFFIPCHRVVSSKGIGGFTMKLNSPFAFFEIDPKQGSIVLKKYILNLEKR